MSRKYSRGQNVEHAKTTVEECDLLDINWLIREGAFDGSSRSNGTITITDCNDYRASFSYNLDQDTRRFALTYTFRQRSIGYTIQLSQTPLPWGGVRWWMHCPLMAGEEPCSRRVSKLWRPRYHTRFGCRRCHDLTYHLCQQSNKKDQGYRGMAAPPYWTAVQQFRHNHLEDVKDRRYYDNLFERRDQRRVRRKAKGWS